MISFKFFHGLGDCSHAAHLFALYTRLGYSIDVECTPDKRPLFEAAGCRVVAHAAETHDWEHAPTAGRPEHHDHWSGNKSAWNISRGPLPDIGSYTERWHDLCAVKLTLDQFLSPAVEQEVDGYIRSLPRPLVLFAPQGNTSTESKNLDHETQAEVLRGLLDLTDGTIIQLDWDRRVYKLPNWRIRHLSDDWHPLDTMELYALIRRADLVIGCDSGVLHFTRFTDTPAIGVWTWHYPSQFALPRKETLHVVPGSRNDLTRYRRVAYNIVESPGERLSGRFIAEMASRMVGERAYLGDPAPDTVLRQLVEKCRQFDSPMTTFVDRHKTFGAFLARARRKARPLIVETGCIRSVEDWSAGYSTYWLGYFLHHHGGELHSIDMDPNCVALARAFTADYGPSVRVHQAHSHDWLQHYSGPPVDLCYLDSADVGTPGYQECSIREVELALPHLAPHAVILFDDTCWKAGSFQGKGSLAVPWLLQRGWKVVAGGYQVLLGKG